MHPPWCDRHHFGDGNHGPPGNTDQSNMAHLAAVYNNPYFQWYARSMPGWPDGGIYGYWWYDADMPARPPADLPQGRYFPDIGWVAMHSDLSDPDDIMLMFKSSQFGSFNHSHADQNSFVVYGYGEPLLIDSGYYDWYGSPHDVGWTRQTRAHNCVLVNGAGQPIFDKTATGQIEQHFTSQYVDYTCGDATVAYKGKLQEFKRRILYARPDVFLIHDTLAAPEPSTFTWCLHAEEEMEVHADRQEVVITRGSAKCLVKFITPTELTFEQNDEFTPPSTRDLKAEWHVYASTTQEHEEMEFLVLVRPYPATRPDEAALPTDVTGNAGSYVLSFREDERNTRDLMVQTAPGTHLAAGQQSAAVPFRVQALAAGRPVFFFANETSLPLADGDETLDVFQASSPVTAAVELSSGPGASPVRKAWCQSPADTDLRLFVGQRPERVDLNAAKLLPGDYQYDAKDRAITLSLPAGDSVIVVNPPPDATTAAAPVTVSLDGRTLPLDLETMHTSSGESLRWGTFSGNAAPVTVDELQAPANSRVQVSRQEAVADQVIWLTESNSLQVRTPEATAPVTLSLRSLITNLAPLAAPIMPDDIADRQGVLKYEAESYSDFGGGAARAYTHRTFLSGGAGVETQIVSGQWLQWDIDVPTGGAYHLVVKGATHEANADRLLLLDGRPLLGEHRILRFGSTGGFGASPQEWKQMAIPGPDGQPLPIKLNAGKHQLRWTTVARRLNLDYWLLVPVQE